ncbi:MAG: phage minor capsid protein [Eubacteriales bacterium]|nr:phage minor capsid protein [Eubacteriales bacterium]
MLTPSYLDGVAEPLAELWAKVERDITADIIRRLLKADYLTPSAQWQVQKAREMGLTQRAIVKEVSAVTKISRRTVRRTVERACAESLNVSVAQYRKAGLDTAPLEGSQAMKQIVSAGVRQTNGLMNNFTKTTAKTALKAFENSLDRAWLKTSSGAFSLGQAVRDAVAELAKNGIGKIAYPTGHTDQVAVAARRAVITGVNHTAGEIQLQAAEEMGTDLVEVSSHPGARPSHAEWQGGIYSVSGKSEKYKPFRETTGYGTGPGLCGWNCRHSFYPFLEGVSEPLRKNDTLNGKTNDELYAESQRQRELERRVRESKRECVALDTARKNAADPEQAAYDAEFARASKLLKQREARLRDYCRETDRKMLVDRVQVQGYTKSVSGKVTAMVKKANAAYTTLASTPDGRQTKATSHLMARAAERGVSADAINDAIRSPLHIKPVKYDEENRPSRQYIGETATVAVNPDTGDVTSAWVTGSRTKKKYQKE